MRFFLLHCHTYIHATTVTTLASSFARCYLCMCVCVCWVCVCVRACACAECACVCKCARVCCACACWRLEELPSVLFFGNFAVVGRQKSVFSGALIGPKLLLLSLHVILKFLPLAAATNQQKTPRAQQYTSLEILCAHGKLNVKHYRTTPKPETHVTSRGRSCAGEKTENRAPKRIQAQQRHSRHHPPPLTTTHTYDIARNIIIGWNLFEYVG